MDLSTLLNYAQVIVRKHFSTDDLILTTPAVIKDGRSLVVRCLVDSNTIDTTSLFIKQIHDDVRGFSEWAALIFLSEVLDIVPQFYGGDREKRIYAIEDLGKSRNLETVFAEANLPGIRKHLKGLAVTMAKMAVETRHRLDEFKQCRVTLPGNQAVGRFQEANQWLRNRDKLENWFEVLGLDIPPHWEHVLTSIAKTYVEPGEFLAFSHGDPAPTNNHVSNRNVRLIDFEYGALRHLLYDITGWYILCPLPESWYAEMHHHFCQALFDGYPMAVCNETYPTAWATMCAYRALAMITWFPTSILMENRPWATGQWTMREALLSTASRLHHATKDISDLRPLADLGEQMFAKCTALWPELGDGRVGQWPDSGFVQGKYKVWR
ncbi:MAG: hypothetical protein O7E52_19935 [Candidatus Poribacteria bacterium]|nr:hypothetical protein [Candidatus Poribacteria bacterium]